MKEFHSSSKYNIQTDLTVSVVSIFTIVSCCWEKNLEMNVSAHSLLIWLVGHCAMSVFEPDMFIFMSLIHNLFQRFQTSFACERLNKPNIACELVCFRCVSRQICFSCFTEPSQLFPSISSLHAKLSYKSPGSNESGIYLLIKLSARKQITLFSKCHTIPSTQSSCDCVPSVHIYCSWSCGLNQRGIFTSQTII